MPNSLVLETKSGSIVVFFPEGNTTNGRGILAIPCVRCDDRMHVVSIHYTDPNISTPLPTDWLSFFYRASCGLTLGMASAPITCRLTQLRPSSVPPANTVYSTVWSDDLRTAISKSITSRDVQAICKPLACTQMDKIAFYEHWDATMRHGQPAKDE